MQDNMIQYKTRQCTTTRDNPIQYKTRKEIARQVKTLFDNIDRTRQDKTIQYYRIYDKTRQDNIRHDNTI